MILLNLLYNKIENFTNEEKKDTDVVKSIYLYTNGYNPNSEYNDMNAVDIFFIAFIYLLFLIISFYAAYLSLSCTWNGRVENIFIRFVFALCAFSLGPIYLLWYLIVNYLFGFCSKG